LASTTTTYTYNNLDQLTAVNLPNTTQDLSYTYDPRGNQTSETTLGVVTGSYTWDARDRLTQATVGANVATYAYDASGRRTRQTLNAVVTKYLWDEQSMYGDVVAELNASNAVTVSYVAGQRAAHLPRSAAQPPATICQMLKAARAHSPALPRR
jgi:YD repeat-containing protein